MKQSSFLGRARSLATVSRSRPPAELTMESCPGEPNRCSKPQLQGVPPSGGLAVTVSLSLLVFVSWGPPPASSSSRPLPALWGWPAELIMESCPGEPNRCSKPQLQGVPSLGTWHMRELLHRPHMRELLHRPHMRELLHGTSHAGIASWDLTCGNCFMGPHIAHDENTNKSIPPIYACMMKR